MRNSLRIVAIKPLPPEDVYNMEVDDTHDFAVLGGIIVHNCADGCRYGLMTRPWVPFTETPRKRDSWSEKVKKDRGEGAESWMAC